ncbi:hypothetical protein CC2G_004318 [Coprinopsis cinerea AmutBmut pab1-1]|nr:hypothetical protein CC2G_004318 [Coprinopsis cinerea AmutBmut pab1-1]
MSAIPHRLILRARTNNAEAIMQLRAQITPRNYTIQALEAILSHFDIERLPKDTSHSSLQSLFSVKPMIPLVRCLSVCLDSCYLNDALGATATRVHDRITGILTWTAVWLKHLLAPESNTNSVAIEDACNVACYMVIVLLGLSTEVDEVVLASHAMFEIVLKSWSSAYHLALSITASDLVPEISGHMAVLTAITRRCMNETQTEFVTQDFINYLTSRPGRVREFATGFVTHLSKLREWIQSESNSERAKLNKRLRETMQTLVDQHLQLLSAVQLRLSLVPTIYSALRKAGVLRASVKVLHAIVSTGIGWEDPFEAILFLVNTLRMSYLPYPQSPLSGLEEVLKAGIHDVMEKVSVAAEKWTNERDYYMVVDALSYFVKVSGAHANQTRGVKALIPAMKSLMKHKNPIIQHFPNLFASGFRNFQMRLDVMGRIKDSPAAYDFCNNETHRSTVGAGVDPSTQRNHRACSQCRSVFYCSRECQKEDWKRRHKSECPSIRSCSIGHQHSEIMYSYRHRVFSLQLALKMFQEQISNTIFILPDDDPSAAYEMVNVFHDAGTFQHNGSNSSYWFLEHILGDKLENVEMCPGTRQRIRALAESVAKKGERGRMSRLVLAFLSYNPGYTFVLAMEVEGNPQIRKWTHVQHVASICPKFSEEWLCNKTVRTAKDSTRFAFPLDRRGKTEIL